MLEHAANAAHECAEGHALPWFACIDQCKDFGPYLLVLVVLLLLSTAIEFVFRKLDDLGAALGKEVFGRVKQELAILGTLSFTMFTAVAIFGGDGDEPTEPAGGHHRRLSAVSGLMPLLFCPFMLMNLALCFSIGPFADAASVAEAMLPVEGGERGGRVVSISTAPPPNAGPPKSGSLNELSVELSSVQSI